ncbi:hypothetical protein [Sporosarcina sp. ACRSM]|nr:hypothetical protein [Sporosarcina sp. ACRSM]
MLEQLELLLPLSDTELIRYNERKDVKDFDTINEKMDGGKA